MCAKRFLDATTDPERIHRWWAEFPHANIGIPTGLTRTVIDVDPTHGGRETMERLLAVHGPLSPTPRVFTGGGGLHILFAPVAGLRNSAGAIGPGVDVRGEGGYVVAPPSRHVSGDVYNDDPDAALFEVPLTIMPDWLVALAMTPGSSANGGPPGGREDGGIPEGWRNDHLFRLGRSLVAKGLSAAAVEAALLAENRARCQPPLPEPEVRKIAAHVMSQPDRPNFARPAGDDDPRPKIDTGNLGLDEMAAAAWAAIEGANAPPHLFLYAGALAWLVVGDAGLPTVQLMNLDHIRHRLAEVATL